MVSTPTQHWEFDKAGGPEVLRLANGFREEPSYGEVRLKVEAVSLNRSDLRFLRDGYVEKPTFPSRFGSEVAGVIEAVGPGFDDLKVGDRVTTVNAFAISQYGTFGETTFIPARTLVPVPDRFTPAEAASFGFAYMTNYFGLFEVGLLKPFQTALVTAASSTTGIAALPMIRSAGAISIATTRTSKKRDALLAQPRQAQRGVGARCLDRLGARGHLLHLRLQRGGPSPRATCRRDRGTGGRIQLGRASR